MESCHQVLSAQLNEYVAAKRENGIRQHHKRWNEARVYTIGGSSLSTIQGKNPYSNINRLIGEKIGLFKFQGDIKMQWGNLFESVIKHYVEKDRGCKIIGEEIYVTGPTGTSYSPDGLTVMNIIDEYVHEEETIEIDSCGRTIKKCALITTLIPKTAIVLMEFKCPFSRIPSGTVPEYYVPQVKMGLDILDIAYIGLFVEGVFRRCTWDQLDISMSFDRSLVPRASGKQPLALGIIGFYIDEDKFKNHVAKLKKKPSETALIELLKCRENTFLAYLQHYVEWGDHTNAYLCNDLGEAPPPLFKLIMDAYDKKIIQPYYCDIVYAAETNAIAAAINDRLRTFTEFCSGHGFKNVGILPWKLFRVDYNYVQKSDNYLAQWLPKIREVLAVVSECLLPENKNKKWNIYNSYVNDSINKCFSDY